MWKKLNNNKKKGFTLVELIVVLVILAILAALLIPALTGYIDKAREKNIIAETRQAVMAAQTLVDEKYAVRATSSTEITVGSGADVTFEAIKTLAEVKGNITEVTLVKSTDSEAKDHNIGVGAIKKLVYTNSGKTCTYMVVPDGTDQKETYKVE